MHGANMKIQNYSRSMIKEIEVKKHNYICMYNSVPTTCFGRFLTAETRSWYAIVHTNIVVFFDCYFLDH